MMKKVLQNQIYYILVNIVFTKTAIDFKKYIDLYYTIWTTC